MSNDRGNEYSRNHTMLNPDNDSQFWNYTWHEIGVYDLSASMDYILKHTNKIQLFYVGSSQGCTTMYVLLSVMPEYNDKIAVYVHLAPVAYMTNVKSIVFRVPAMIFRILQVTIFFSMF